MTTERCAQLNLVPLRDKLRMLYDLWDQLGDIPVADGTGELAADTLEEEFLGFEPGTPREEVWRWFEAQHRDFRVGDVQQGIRFI